MWQVSYILLVLCMREQSSLRFYYLDNSRKIPGFIHFAFPASSVILSGGCIKL